MPLQTNYTGTQSPPIEQEVAPIPGGAPVMAMPTDEAGGAASLYPPWKSAADYLAYLQKAAKWWPPLAPTAGSAMTAVDHVGSGTGTIAQYLPSLPGGQRGARVVIEITVSGTANDGITKYKFSLDGGGTWSAEDILPSFPDVGVGGGLVLQASGDFVAGDTYALAPAFPPQAAWCDSAGNIRHLIDHNGFPMGRRSEITQEWWASDSDGAPASIASVPLALDGGAAGWVIDGDADGDWTNDTDATIASRKIGIVTSGTNAKKNYIRPRSFAFKTAANVVFVAEWEHYTDALGVTAATKVMGLFDSFTDPSASTNKLIFKAAASAHWFCYTNSANADSGFAVTSAGWQKVRLEYHGAATALGVINGGPVALFFINDGLVSIQTAGVVAAGVGLTLGFGHESTSANAGYSFWVSPVRMTWNRFLSLPSL